MPKIKSNLETRKNKTEEKLRATPFDSIVEMEAEEKAIRESVWKRFKEAQVINELLSKPEFTTVSTELSAGLSCKYSDSESEEIYRIYSEGKGLKLSLNKSFVEGLGEDQIRFYQGVVQAGIEGYGNLYMQIKSVVSKPPVDAKIVDTLNSKQNKK